MENILDLDQLEGQSPQAVAQLLIDLSQLLDGRRTHFDGTASSDLFAKILPDKHALEHVILEQDNLVFSFTAIFQYVLWSKIDQPACLELILETLNEANEPAREEDNKYLKIVKDTFSKTVIASRDLASKITMINDDLNRLQKRSSDESIIIATKMTTLTQELNQLREETIMDADAFYRKLNTISAVLDQIQEDMKRQDVQVTSSRKILNLASAIAIVCLLGLIMLIWFAV